MAAVWIRLRAELRTRWRAWLVLALIAGLAGGFVTAIAAGARRTDSTITRWRAATGTVDVWVGKSRVYSLESDFARVERLPQVADAVRSVDLAFWGRTDDGRAVTVNQVELNAPVGGDDCCAARPILLAGRPPHRARADEVFIDSAAAERFDLRVGSTLRARFATPGELIRIVDTGDHDARADPETAGSGLLLGLRVVGIRAGLLSEDALPLITMSPAFYGTYGQRVASWIEFTGIRLERGDSDLGAFRAGVERIAGGEPVGIYPKRNIVAKLERSIHLQAQALWVLAALGALAALLLVGQAVARQTTLESVDHALLRSLGMTHRQLFALGMARVAPVALAAGALAAASAVALSPLAPIGVARTAEPDPGLAVDSLAVGLGGAMTVAFVVLATLVPAWRASRSRVDQVEPRPSVAVDLLTRAGLRPSRVAGVRMALESGRGRTAVPVRTTLLAAIIGVASVAAALTFTASADRLLSSPRLYGHNWDAVIGNGTDPSSPKRFVDRLRADRSIANLAGGTVDEAGVGGRPTGVLAIDTLEGSLPPTLLEGRAPVAMNEIVLGAKTADALAVDVGEEVEGRIGDRSLTFRVVGRGVLPEVAVAGTAPLGLGRGAAMTFEALRRLKPQASRNVFLLELTAGAERREALARLGRDAAAAVPGRPADVANWGRVSVFPYVLAALIAAAAAAVLAHALVTSIRRRRRELAILKTLGFERRDVRMTVAWQATTVAAVGLLLGLPLGIGIGRFAWNLFAEQLGVVPEPVVPIWPAAVVVVAATLLVAHLVALVPGRIAAGTRPALVLRAE